MALKDFTIKKRTAVEYSDAKYNAAYLQLVIILFIISILYSLLYSK